jgi:hypothetical protein
MSEKKAIQNFSIVLAFVCGCVTALGLRLVVAAHAASGGPGAAQDAIGKRLDALERRADALYAGEGLSSKVVAPFQVVKRAGDPVFSVTTNGANVYGGGKVAASMSGEQGGGRLVVSSFSGRSVRLDASAGPSFSVAEGGVDARGRSTSSTRIELGKSPTEGTYRLMFMSNGHLNIAGIGEDLKTHTGLALVFDEQGKAKARLAVSDEGKGLIDILGSQDLPIAQLTQGVHGGGLFLICAVSGCPPRMVEMGDAGGFGMVSTGPHWFNPGATMFSLQGSALFGRP